MQDRAEFEKIQAPFTPEQVASLNDFQKSGVMHPFTCGPCRDGAPGTRDADGNWISDRCLTATVAGWICETCDYTQQWAWAWMADRTWEGFKLPF